MKKSKSTIKYLSQYLSKYKVGIFFLIFTTILVNILTLTIPRITAPMIDSVFDDTFNQSESIVILLSISTGILLFTFVQNILTAIISESIIRDLREDVSEKISKQSFGFINKITPAKLLTNLTSDANAVKSFISQGIVVVVSSIILIIGSAILLLILNWRLALLVLLSIPLIIIIFNLTFRIISKYFIKQQQIIDTLNKVINESIVGASLIRVLNSQSAELNKFSQINNDSRDIGMKIVRLISSLFPIISLISNLTILIVVWYGGNQIIDDQLFYGDFTAFITYITTFITPILLLGFIANVLVRAQASFSRILDVLDAPIDKSSGTVDKEIIGDIVFEKVNLEYENKPILKDISFHIKPNTKNAIIGPTASGKTQIFYLLSKLIKPNSGSIVVDEIDINDYKDEAFFKSIGLVFQDSIIFNTSIRENIAFDSSVEESEMQKATESSEMDQFIDTLENGYETLVSERGVSLSGGQKQRLTLARALSQNPNILLLDDFTSRVDINTEKRILKNIDQNYPDITIISITQKIEPIKNYDQILFIMEGELVAKGTHNELINNSFEYKQLFESQMTTNE